MFQVLAVTALRNVPFKTQSQGRQSFIVDTSLKGGGTVNGMIVSLREFDSELAGGNLLADNAQKNVKSSLITSHS